LLTEWLIGRAPVWLLHAGTVVLLFAAREIGFRIAAWRATRNQRGDRRIASAPSSAEFR
jgi:hypothetical protein